MSKQNKANRNNYTQAGRLTPDDLAREQERMNRDQPTNRERAIGGGPRGRDEQGANRPRSAPEKAV
jgi:hypothetical protein